VKIGRIIKSNGISITLGFDETTADGGDGFRVVTRENLGFLALDGDFIEVYDDGKGNSVYAKHAPEVFNSLEAPTVGSFGEDLDKGIKINKIAYILLAMFLGGLGAHKFAVKKFWIGVLYLVFFWTYIPALIGFVEGCITISKKADPNGDIYIE